MTDRIEGDAFAEEFRKAFEPEARKVIDREVTEATRADRKLIHALVWIIIGLCIVLAATNVLLAAAVTR